MSALTIKEKKCLKKGGKKNERQQEETFRGDG